jgi:hypothetical protein
MESPRIDCVNLRFWKILKGIIFRQMATMAKVRWRKDGENPWPLAIPADSSWPNKKYNSRKAASGIKIPKPSPIKRLFLLNIIEYFILEWFVGFFLVPGSWFWVYGSAVSCSGVPGVIKFRKMGMPV